ncbi:DUF6301 family protein [Nocardia abscessus]|uniref:DUF6301 family protein n=1 Tax=Nocardia abscessus TaxID=120957 RepID=UPI002453DEB6|nr:DUF6301 family protein [Nocardia abscessus]
MTEWRALTDSEIVALATSLRSLDGSQPMDALPRLAESLGWKVLTAHSDRALLDVGFGMGSGKIHGREGQIVDVKVRVTDFAPDDAEGRARSRDTFAAMVAALTGALGAPTARIPGATAEVRWAGPEATLVLEDLGRSVQLSLVANSWLALHDQAIELEDQEQS